MKWWQEIKNKKCKHDWIKLHKKGAVWVLFIFLIMDFDYLHCAKCGSSTADETGLSTYKKTVALGRTWESDSK